MAMQKCSYCGRENDDTVHSCVGCGTSLTEPPTEIPLRTPHQMMGELQRSIWEHFALKRRQFYLAAFLIGAFGGLIAALQRTEQGFALWPLAAGGALGVGAVGLLSFAERLQARIHQARAEGKSTGVQYALFVVFTLIALLVVTLLIAGLCAFLL